MHAPFNVKKHSDISVTVIGEPGDEKTFHLHKFPLISKSHYFEEHIPDLSQVPDFRSLVITDFPGGPSAFEVVAKYCYGIDVELTIENLAHVYCAARAMRVTEMEKSTEQFLSSVVLQDPAKSAVVLKVATTIPVHMMTDAMMEGLVGHCINAIAAMFTPTPELNALPSDCFATIVRAARDMDADKRTLEAAVLSYLDAHVPDPARPPPPPSHGASSAGGDASAGGLRLSIEEFLEVTAAPGRMDDMRHCEAVYGFLEALLRAYRSDAEAEALCKGLHELGFWVCLPHLVIERAYSDRNIPDRYCTVALMAENRHLIKVNEQLAEQVEALTETLRAETAGRMQQQGGGMRH